MGLLDEGGRAFLAPGVSVRRGDLISFVYNLGLNDWPTITMGVGAYLKVEAPIYDAFQSLPHAHFRVLEGVVAVHLGTGHSVFDPNGKMYLVPIHAMQHIKKVHPKG